MTSLARSSRISLALVAAGCAACAPQALQRDVLDHAGARIVHRSLGEGPVVVMIHGAATSRIFDPVLADLARTREVVTYDRRGYGETIVDESVAPAPSRAVDVADVEALRIELGAERIDVLGFSNGGPIAIDYALAHPDRVDRLVLLSTYADDDARTELAWERLEPIVRDRARVAALERIAADPALDDTSRAVEAFLVSPHTHHVRGVQREWVEDWVRTGALDPHPTDAQRRVRGEGDRPYARLAALATLACPTLVLAGDGDAVTPLPHAREMAAGLVNGTLVVLEGCGHCAFVEDAERFVAEVDAFLRER